MSTPFQYSHIDAASLSKSGIYCIKNLLNDKIYVGSAVCFKRRFRRHLAELRTQKHHSKKLQNAWNKEGELSFIFEILEYTDNLLSREQSYMDKNNSYELGYNCTRLASSALGIKRSEATKQQTSETLKSKGVIPWNKGQKASRETIQKLKEASSHKKSIFVLDRNKRSIVRQYKSLSEAASEFNLSIAKLSRHCLLDLLRIDSENPNKFKYIDSYLFCYEQDYNKLLI